MKFGIHLLPPDLKLSSRNFYYFVFRNLNFCISCFHANILLKLQHSSVGGAGVEPDVHDVGVLGPLGSTALFADFACGDDLLGFVLIPCIGTFLAEQVADSLDGGIGDVVGAALLAVECGDGHAPGALAATGSICISSGNALS